MDLTTLLGFKSSITHSEWGQLSLDHQKKHRQIRTALSMASDINLFLCLGLGLVTRCICLDFRPFATQFRSYHGGQLPTLSLGLPVIDNCPTWFRGRGWIAVEKISRQITTSRAWDESLILGIQVQCSTDWANATVIVTRVPRGKP